MRVILQIVIFLSISTACLGRPYLFYLHGKIVEDQGARASNPAFGNYEYDSIIAAFRKEGFTVISEVRRPNTDITQYAHKIAAQVDSLLHNGAKAGDITIVGASKGAAIAMVASSLIRNPGLNYVFMSSCNDYVASQFPDLSFCGNILSVYEKSDDGNQSCDKLSARSKLQVPHYAELELNTGLRHGYLYKPLPEWVAPVTRWAHGDYSKP